MLQNEAHLTDLLVCPRTRQRLWACSRAEAETRLQSRLAALGVPGEPVGAALPGFNGDSRLLVRDDWRSAYPIVDGIPILLVPEMLGCPDVVGGGVRDPRYAEAYEEMAFYNEASTREAEDIMNSQSYASIDRVLLARPRVTDRFPEPRDVWLDAIYDSAAQWDAYAYLAPIRGKRIMQLGGKGAHAVKFLLAGAAEAWAVTPMLGEAHCAMALASAVGVADRLRCVVAVAEELPFAADSFDAVYSGGSLHHMVTEAAIPEVVRILKQGGQFAATDPWRAPLYAIGTKIFGNREANAYCRPLTKERVGPVRKAFHSSAIVQHGTLTRYLLLALSKLGLHVTFSMAWRLNKIDDAICSVLPGFRKWGSSVACLGTKV